MSGIPDFDSAIQAYLPEPLQQVVFVLTSPIAIMLGAVVFLVAIAFILSPNGPEEAISADERAANEAFYRKTVEASLARRSDSTSDGDQSDGGSEDEEEDDAGIAEADPRTGKFKES